jgi:hypothetical protein
MRLISYAYVAATEADALRIEADEQRRYRCVYDTRTRVSFDAEQGDKPWRIDVTRYNSCD